MKLFRVLLFLMLMPLMLHSQANYVSQEIKVNPLIKGTLLKVPEANKLLIIIPGSGPTDRDGNQQMMRNDALKKLAEGVSKQGISTFRYDKRILTLLRQRALQEEKLRFDNFIDDAVEVIRYFIAKNQYQDIYVLGHSQGALVGMVAAQKETVAGFISLAGAGQSIDQTIINQIKLQMPDLEEKAKIAFDELKEKGRTKNYSPALESIFRPQVQPFMASWMQYNPRREIRKLKIPTLIVGGTEDLQADVKEAEVLKKAKPDAQLELISGMNHVLRKIETNDDLTNSKTYNNTQLPIMPELVTIVTAFIKS